MTSGIDRRTFLAAALGATAAAMTAPHLLAQTRPAVTGVEQAGKALKLLVLGGTGFLGPHIVRYAQARGHTLTLFNRGKTRPGLFPDTEKLQGDRDGQLDALKGRKWDAVIDTSGYVPRIVKMSAELLAANVGQYLFVSTVSVYQMPMKPGADESAKLLELDDPASEDVNRYYGALKAACEVAAEAAMPGRVANVRPGLIVGPEDPTDRYTYWPVRMDRGGEVLCPGDGTAPAQYVDVRDLAEFLVTSAENNTTGIYNAARPTITMKELVDAANEAAGNKATPVWVPEQFVRRNGVMPWQELTVWTGMESAGMARASTDKAVAKGLRSRPPLETARDTLAWWKTLSEVRTSRLRAGLAPEKETTVLTRWKATQTPATTPARP